MSDSVEVSAKSGVDTAEWSQPPGAMRSLTYHLIARGASILFRLFWRWKLIDIENIPLTGGVMLAANHASNLDPPMLGAAMHGYRPCHLMGKSELWKNRLGGKILDQLGAFPVQRHSADRPTLRRVLAWLKAGEPVGMFPEGERTPDGNLQLAQPGIALLVQKASVPVIPVAIIGTWKAWPKGRKLPRPSHVKIIFGKPLVFQREADRDEVTDTIMQAIADLMTANGEPTLAPRRAECP